MNQIDIQFNNESPEIKNVLIAAVQTSLDKFNIDGASLEIIFVNPEEIQELNKKYRQIDKPTDVLSFPQTLVPRAKIRLLGSIVIAKQMVTLKNEDLSDVIKHGLLHLLGFDHEVDEKSWQNEAKKINCNL